ncbi:MAG: helix-turn-helix transcriptional regulator [Acetatifactor sp.]
MMEEFVRNRITQLRLNKGISEYQLSYDLGHSRGYINNISSGKSLPSMSEFFAICEYFHITPIEFFDENHSDPELVTKTWEEFQSLNDEDMLLILSLIKRIKNGE